MRPVWGLVAVAAALLRAHTVHGQQAGGSGVLEAARLITDGGFVQLPAVSLPTGLAVKVTSSEPPEESSTEHTSEFHPVTTLPQSTVDVTSTEMSVEVSTELVTQVVTVVVVPATAQLTVTVTTIIVPPTMPSSTPSSTSSSLATQAPSPLPSPPAAGMVLETVTVTSHSVTTEAAESPLVAALSTTTVTEAASPSTLAARTETATVTVTATNSVQATTTEEGLTATVTETVSDVSTVVHTEYSTATSFDIMTLVSTESDGIHYYTGFSIVLFRPTITITHTSIQTATITV